MEVEIQLELRERIVWIQLVARDAVSRNDVTAAIIFEKVFCLIQTGRYP